MSQQKNPSPEEAGQDYDYLGKSASATDCTGLIPFAPVNRQELSSYQEVYPFEPRAAAPKEKHPDRTV